MSPIRLLLRTFDASLPSGEFSQQWTQPSDCFSILLLLGGDVIARAVAQLVGGWITPVAFSFGWVAYAVTAVVAAVGENKLMPPADFSCKVINGNNGYVRDNTSWVIGRVVRDYEGWMDKRVDNHLGTMRAEKWKELKKRGIAKKPMQVGLCVSIYRAQIPVCIPAKDLIYYSGFGTIILQLSVAAIPCGISGDWSILMITACGILLSFATGSLPQWRAEKWACQTLDQVKPGKEERVILTRGNGSQHAIVILGGKGCLDLEDLAVSATNADFSTSWDTRIALFILAVLWILLLVTAAGIHRNTLFLLAVGAMGIVQNIIVAGARRNPAAFGLPLTFEGVIGKSKVMETLYAVDEEYKGLGHAMLDTFFPGGKLRDAEKARWAELDSRLEHD